MQIEYIYNKLTFDRKEILKASLGNDIVKSFFYDVLVEEQIRLQNLDSNVLAEEFKYKYINVKNSINAIEALLNLITKLKKQNGETK